MKINHIGYLVSNLQKAIDEFEKLGYEKISEIIHDTIRLVDICFMSMDGYNVELVSPYDKASVVAGLAKKYKNMPYHICYESEEFMRSLKYLEANGYTRIDEPLEAPAFGGRRVCFLLSAKAGMIEILEGCG